MPLSYIDSVTSENRDFRYDRFRKVSEGKRDRLAGYQFTDVVSLEVHGHIGST